MILRATETDLRKSIKESDIRKQIKDYLGLIGAEVWHNLQGLGCYRGLPDLEGYRGNRHFFIEIKRPGGEQRPDQKKFEDMVNRHGGTYILADSYEDVQKVLLPGPQRRKS